MIKNIESKYDYQNMYNWTNDLPENSLIIFESVLNYVNRRKKDKIEMLEVGTYVGTSAIKLLETVRNSRITVIDQWKNYIEINGVENTVEKIEENEIEKIFYKNIEISGLQDRFIVKKGNSFEILLELLKENKKYDIIYIDGDHTLLQSYLDIKIAFELLDKGGILIIDDYLFNSEDILNSPFVAVKRFLEDNESKMKILNKGYRVFLEKK